MPDTLYQPIPPFGLKPEPLLTSMVLEPVVLIIWVSKLTNESQGSVPCVALSSWPSFTPPKSESATSHRVQDMFSSQFSIPSSSSSPESSFRVGSVSPGSICPLLLLSSSPSSNSSPSVLLLRGSVACAGFPYCPLTSTPSMIPSLSVSAAVGSVRRTNAS